jgi:peptide/nickel transport system substrate-binding protein
MTVRFLKSKEDYKMKKISRRNFLKCAGLSTVAIGMAACGSSSKTPASSAGASTSSSAVTAEPAHEIIIGDYADSPNSAAWMIRTGGDKAHWVYTIYEPLFTMSEDGTVVPYLADSLTTDADALTYTVKLRDDVVFSDGSKLDADALLWNFENFKEKATTSSTHFGSVDHFEKISDNEVAIHMATWSSQIPYSLCSAAGLMYSKKAFDDNGYDWCLQNPVGTGPYLLDEWTTDDHKTFSVNPNYWNPNVKPQITKITIKVVPDETTAQAAMLSGDLDVFSGTYNFTKEMEAQGFPRICTKMWYYSDFIIFASAIENSPMNDVRVRQAICYAIDSKTIQQTIDMNMSLLTNQYAIEGTPFYTDTVKGYGYDPDKAKSLLAEAGYADGFSTTLYTGTDLNLDKQMVAVQGYLQQVGITVDLEYQDVSIWSSKTIYSIEEGMVMVCHGFGTNIVNQAVANFSKQAVNGVGMLKDCALHPDDVDAALMSALSAKDNASMIANFATAQQLIFDKYCLAYPVDSDSYSWQSVRDTFVDNGCFGTTTEYYNYTLLTIA